VEEFGRLDVYIKAFAYNKDGHERMRMEIHSWYDGSAADKDSTPRARITSCMWGDKAIHAGSNLRVHSHSFEL
jgi:hypothetical protein